MRVVNEPVIARFIRKHADSRVWLRDWLEVTRAAVWRSIQEVKQAYPAADGGVHVASGASVTVFDVCGNRYRLIVNIIYARETVLVLDVLPHAEYSKNRWKDRY